MSYLGHSLGGGSYPSAEAQSVYSADWATVNWSSHNEVWDFGTSDANSHGGYLYSQTTPDPHCLKQKNMGWVYCPLEHMPRAGQFLVSPCVVHFLGGTLPTLNGLGDISYHPEVGEGWFYLRMVVGKLRLLFRTVINRRLLMLTKYLSQVDLIVSLKVGFVNISDFGK